MGGGRAIGAILIRPYKHSVQCPCPPNREQIPYEMFLRERRNPMAAVI